jgi:NADH dehydrogenase FAD-containing subunit
LSPSSIAPTGHIKVKPTLQIADDALPNVYVCGDVTDTHVVNPNARSAMRQATIAADNIVQQTNGQCPSYEFKPYWADGFIKLTLGLVS